MLLMRHSLLFRLRTGKPVSQPYALAAEILLKFSQLSELQHRAIVTLMNEMIQERQAQEAGRPDATSSRQNPKDCAAA